MWAQRRPSLSARIIASGKVSLPRRVISLRICQTEEAASFRKPPLVTISSGVVGADSLALIRIAVGVLISKRMARRQACVGGKVRAQAHGHAQHSRITGRKLRDPPGEALRIAGRILRAQ